MLFSRVWHSHDHLIRRPEGPSVLQMIQHLLKRCPDSDKKKKKTLKLPVQLQQSFNLSIIWSHVNSHRLSGWTQIKECWDALCTTDLCNLCCWKTLLCLPSVPAKWIACEHRSEPHRKEQAMISNSLLWKSPQRRGEVCFWQQRLSSWTVRVLTWDSFPEGWSSCGWFCLSLFHIIVEKRKWRHWPARSGAFTLCALFNSRWIRICGEGHYHVWRVFVLGVLSHFTDLSQAVFFFFYFGYGLYLFSFGGNRVKRPWESFGESFFSLRISHQNSCTVILKGLCVR